MEKKENFYKVYSNLPLGVRDEVVLVVDDEPITWKVARLEIDNNTPLSMKIMDKLIALEII